MYATQQQNPQQPQQPTNGQGYVPSQPQVVNQGPQPVPQQPVQPQQPAPQPTQFQAPQQPQPQQQPQYQPLGQPPAQQQDPNRVPELTDYIQPLGQQPQAPQQQQFVAGAQHVQPQQPQNQLVEQLRSRGVQLDPSMTDDQLLDTSARSVVENQRLRAALSQALSQQQQPGQPAPTEQPQQPEAEGGWSRLPQFDERNLAYLDVDESTGRYVPRKDETTGMPIVRQELADSANQWKEARVDRLNQILNDLPDVAWPEIEQRVNALLDDRDSRMAEQYAAADFSRHYLATNFDQLYVIDPNSGQPQITQDPYTGQQIPMLAPKGQALRQVLSNLDPRLDQNTAIQYATSLVDAQFPRQQQQSQVPVQGQFGQQPQQPQVSQPPQYQTLGQQPQPSQPTYVPTTPPQPFQQPSNPGLPQYQQQQPQGYGYMQSAAPAQPQNIAALGQIFDQAMAQHGIQ